MSDSNFRYDPSFNTQRLMMSERLISMCIFLLLIWMPVAGFGQPDFEREEAELAFYADVMVNATKAEHRVRANDSLVKKCLRVLGMPGSVTYPFDSLVFMSRLVPQDSAFRLFSWQVRVSNDRHTYHAILQDLREDTSLIVFQDNRPVVNGPEYADYTSETWYGALYYSILAVEDSIMPYYVLLGLDWHDDKTNYKIADILWFDGDRIRLGYPVFLDPGTSGRPKKRLLIEYSDVSPAGMRFDMERESIVYDHIIPVAGMGGQGDPILAPDGSYEGYALQDGQWIYVEKMFHQISDEAPRPAPILDKDKSRDILGRKKQDP